MRGWLNPLRGSGIRGWLNPLRGPGTCGCRIPPPRLHRDCSPKDIPGGSDRVLLPIGGRGVERDLSRYGCGQCRALLQVCCAEVNFADFHDSHDCAEASYAVLRNRDQINDAAFEVPD